MQTIRPALIKPEEYLIRYVGPRDGHTARSKGKTDEYISANVSYRKNLTQLNSNTYAVFTTALDDEINIEQYESYAYFNQSSCSLDDSVVTLNQKKLWEIVPDILERNCISKRTKTTRFGRFDKLTRQEILYELPVTGEKIIYTNNSQAAKQKKLDRYLHFQGRKYDCCILHFSSSPANFQSFGKYKLLDNSKLRQVVGVLSLHGKFEHNAIDVSWMDNIPYRCTWYYQNNDKYIIDVIKWTRNNKLTSIDIKLQKEMLITHISTMGRKYFVRAFPSYLEAKEYDIPYKKTISYITEKEHHYVTTYEIKYKSHKSRWVSLGTFVGNKDRLTEVQHKFDYPIMARQLRIIPKTFCGSPSMQIALFNDGGKTDGGKIADSKTKALDKTSDVKTTVTYRLEYPSELRYVPDTGYQNERSRKSPSHLRRLTLKLQAHKDRLNYRQITDDATCIFDTDKYTGPKIDKKEKDSFDPNNNLSPDYWLAPEELFEQEISDNIMNWVGSHTMYCDDQQCNICIYLNTGVINL